jgi:hypothetical protein
LRQRVKICGTTFRVPHSCSWRNHSHRIHVSGFSM